jgi:hypothetical protein
MFRSLLGLFAASLLPAAPLFEKADVFSAGDAGYALYRIPGLTVTNQGSVLAYAEARQGKRGDWGTIDIVLRRSTDGGKTWSPQRIVAAVPGPKTKNPVALAQNLATPGEVTYNNPVAMPGKARGTVHLVFCLEYMRAFHIQSNDDGVTWSTPREITSTFEGFRPRYDWKVLATGPGHGIRLSTGRLLIPVWISTGTGGHAHRPSVAATIYSDDDGATWKAGDIALPNEGEWKIPNETAAVELSDGRVLLNARSESAARRRLLASSPDGATQWTRPAFHPQLHEPICQGSMARLSTKRSHGRDRLLFSNPDSETRDRRNVTVQLSYDESQTWPIKRTIEAGPSGYSDLAVLPSGDILLLYERTGTLALARFNLEWLSEGKDSLVTLNETADGYRGIWYFNQPSNDEYVYKYSGGFATYPQQQSPIAIYAPAAHKTFFVYGGATNAAKPELLHMVSYFDHRTGTVPRPTVLLNKHTDDAHDNPVLSIDDAGHLWVFSNSHGVNRPSYIHRSKKPYDIRDFELVYTGNFSYGHIWHQPNDGFLFLHTLYERGGRSSYTMSSADGQQWTKPTLLSRIELGHYQITAHAGRRTAAVFNFHPDPAGLNARTNLYYMETRDHGKTWQTITGQPLSLPLTNAANPALVHNYQAEKKVVYLKSVTFDQSQNPVLLYLTANGYESGPKHGLRQWHTARWTGAEWQIRPVTTSDHNYDFGELSIDADGAWRLIAPTDPGARPYTTGGDMVLWSSRDQGATWKRVRRLNAGTDRNHTYAKRPLNAHPDFAALWADGDTLKPSGSRLYFTNREGTAVWQLPEQMTGETAKPKRVARPPQTVK